MEAEAVDVEVTVPVVDAKRVKCPYCARQDQQKQYGQSPDGSIGYYRCGVCVYPDRSGDHTKYKVRFV